MPPANAPVTVTVTYTPADDPNGPDIQFTFPNDPSVPFGSQTTYNLVRASSNFDFTAISFKGADSDGNESNVFRTFQKYKDGVANFRGEPFVTQVNAQSKSSISFNVVNNFETDGGTLSFQVTIADKQTLFTSKDPQIILEQEDP